MMNHVMNDCVVSEDGGAMPFKSESDGVKSVDDS